MQKAIGKLALFLFPLIARFFGYTFKTGTQTALVTDALRVLQTVHATKGGLPPKDLQHLRIRYDQASTWIVAYQQKRPVGVIALLDIRTASIALDLAERTLPEDWNEEKTREIGRLAIVLSHRGRPLVMAGIIREVLKQVQRLKIDTLLAHADYNLYRIYAGYTPSIRVLDLPTTEVSADTRRYFHYLRASSSAPVLFAFDVNNDPPCDVFRRYWRHSLRSAFSSNKLQADDRIIN